MGGDREVAATTGKAIVRPSAEVSDERLRSLRGRTVPKQREAATQPDSGWIPVRTWPASEFEADPIERGEYDDHRFQTW